jgi:hypothetical protein
MDTMIPKQAGASPKSVENIIGPSVDLGEAPGFYGELFTASRGEMLFCPRNS